MSAISRATTGAVGSATGSATLRSTGCPMRAIFSNAMPSRSAFPPNVVPLWNGDKAFHRRSIMLHTGLPAIYWVELERERERRRASHRPRQQRRPSLEGPEKENAARRHLPRNETAAGLR